MYYDAKELLYLEFIGGCCTVKKTNKSSQRTQTQGGMV